MVGIQLLKMTRLSVFKPFDCGLFSSYLSHIISHHCLFVNQKRFAKNRHQFSVNYVVINVFSLVIYQPLASNCNSTVQTVLNTFVPHTYAKPILGTCLGIMGKQWTNTTSQKREMPSFHWINDNRIRPHGGYLLQRRNCLPAPCRNGMIRDDVMFALEADTLTFKLQTFGSYPTTGRYGVDGPYEWSVKHKRRL